MRSDRSSRSSSFQSTLSVRRATLRCVGRTVRDNISIHALREESDSIEPVDDQETKYFNPRSP